jgi:hypothetical protein
MGVNLGGEQVTITGTGFTDASAVTFGSTPATSFTVVSDTEITAIAPAVALTETYPSGLPHNMLDVSVTTPNGTSVDATGAQFNYVQTPTITAVSPANGPTAGGNTVTITGTGFKFSRVLEVAGLAFGSTPVTNYTVNSDTQITATVPAGAVGIDDVTVATPGGTSATSPADQYVYHPTCTTTITGTNSTKITVSSGLTGLVDATQTGQVTVEAGAALSVTGSTVTGAVTATDPAEITYCGSTETGNLTVTGATGPVVLSGALPDGTACAADTISGAVMITGASAPVTVTGLNGRGKLTLENDTAGVDLDGGQLNGPAYVSDNTATAPAAITVSGVAVTGPLYCTGNSPAPTDAGTLNTVSAATASDQCTDLEEH